MKNRSNYAAAWRGVAAFSVVLALAGCKKGGQTGAQVASANGDFAINNALQEKLEADPGLANQPLHTWVSNGTVTIVGHIDNIASHQLAGADAASIPGVTKVNNYSAMDVRNTADGAVPIGAPDPPAPDKEPAHVAKVDQPAAPIERPQPQQDSPYPAPPQTTMLPQTTYQPPTRPEPAPLVFHTLTIPQGTTIAIRMTQTLDSATAQTGTTFSASLASDVIADGTVALPTGARVMGRVMDAKDAGHYSGNSRLSIALTSLTRRGETIPIATDSYIREGTGRGKNTAEKVGGGAAVGAILGGIFGGGKGAAIGAGAGGAVGAGANGVTRGQQVQIQSESVVRFTLTSPINLKVASTEQITGPGTDLQPRN